MDLYRVYFSPRLSSSVDTTITNISHLAMANGIISFVL